jgi:opacity protein-like surface antigen
MQGQKILLAVMSGAALLSIAMPAAALQMSTPEGWYAEANIGTAHLSGVNYEGSTNNNGATYNLNLGYKIMPYAAIEAGYTKYKNSKIEIDGETLANVSHYSYDLSAKGILPVYDTGFELFAKLGAQHMRAKATAANSSITGDISASNQSTGPYYGIGGQFNVMSELGIVVQWQRAQGNNNTGTEDFFSVGVAFIFV